MIRDAERKLHRLEHLIRLLHRFQAIYQWRLELLRTDLDPFGDIPALVQLEDMAPIQDRLGADLFNIALRTHKALSDPLLTPPVEFQQRIEDVIRADEITRKIMLRKALGLGNAGVRLFHRFWDRTGDQVDKWLKPFRVYAGIFILAGHVGALSLVVNSQITHLKNEIIQSEQERQATAEELELQELERIVFSIAGESTNWSQLRDKLRSHLAKEYPDESILIWSEYRHGVRENLLPDATYDKFFFEKAQEIEEFFLVLMRGKEDADGKMIFPGAAERMDRREKITDLLNFIFFEIEEGGADKFLGPKDESPSEAMSAPRRAD
jgi:hypothetical protein